MNYYNQYKIKIINYAENKVISTPLYAFKIISSIIHVNIVQNIEAIFTDLLDSPGARASGFYSKKLPGQAGHTGYSLVDFSAFPASCARKS